MEVSKRVLSIQSHVVHGYVGNKAATFPLQLLGWDVDVINTVQFSNHSGYRSRGGAKTDKAQLVDIFTILEKNEFTQIDALLTGYTPDAEALSATVDFAIQLMMKNPELLFVLDPVMGDDGKMYVANNVLPIYRDQLLSLATVITPNWFEVELLTGIQLTSRDSIRSALRSLHEDQGVRNVVITSIVVREGSQLFGELRDMGLLTKSNFSPDDILKNGDMMEYILCVSSTRDSPTTSTIHALTVPRLKGYFSGVGDIFSALILAHFKLALDSSSPSPLSAAASRALHTTHSILYRTHKHALAVASKLSDSPSSTPNTYTDDELDAQEPLRRRPQKGSTQLKRCDHGKDFGTLEYTAQPIQPFEVIPVIDISGLSGDEKSKIQVATEIREACIHVGFFYGELITPYRGCIYTKYLMIVRNHGVDQQIIDATVEAARQFFDLPLEEKEKIDIHKSSNFKGYTALLGENTNPENRGDLHEGFDIGLESSDTSLSMGGMNVWPPPDILPGFRNAVLRYYQAVVDLGLRLFPAFALALDLPEDFFSDKFKIVVKTTHVPSIDTSYECFTILWQDNVPALQVLNTSGQWVDAKPMVGTFVIKLLTSLLDDVFKSTVHRAINRSGVRRYSMPLFFGTDYHALPSCVSDGRPPRYEPVLAGDYVKSRLEATYAHSNIMLLMVMHLPPTAHPRPDNSSADPIPPANVTK
ncbi:Pyridoxal kinase [Ceratobasidium theobromae]|uniref:pyridoxal kinase n=1 Tax=Ceratobasidium theobromae TaxID=1582974 RepID=A0A5N5QIM7_9AGAM|nr:Pyridoxal kinase [Ceratobasidium theobromae]